MIIVSPAFRKTSFSKCFLSQYTEAPKGYTLIGKDGLVWTVLLTVEIKLCFRDGLVWKVGLTVETKLRFRDGLVWTVGLTVEIKLRIQIYIWSIIEEALAWCLSANKRCYRLENWSKLLYSKRTHLWGRRGGGVLKDTTYLRTLATTFYWLSNLS